MFYIYSYNNASASARALRDALGARLIKSNNSRYRKRGGHVVINWGKTTPPDYEVDLNQPDRVAVASNKLSALEALQEAGVSHVPFTTSRLEAESWIVNGAKVFVRSVLNGHSGEGITVANANNDISFLGSISEQLSEEGWDYLAEMVDNEADNLFESLPEAPLYTHGLQNHGEYRVHVFNGEVILYQKKSRRVDDDGNVITADGEHADVRNLTSNWIYRTGDLRRLERIEHLAVDAVAALGLDFGAVDIIKDENGNVFVLEVNTAPGLGNTATLEAYVNAFNSN